MRAPSDAVRLSPRGRAVTAVIAIASLAAGLMLKPAEAVLPSREESPGPLLHEVVEQREAVSMFRVLQNVATDAAPFVARVIATAPPAQAWSDWDAGIRPPIAIERFGVVVNPSELLVFGAGLPSDGALQVQLGDGRMLTGTITQRLFAEFARVAVRLDQPLRVPRVAEVPIRPGDPVVATAPGVQGGVVAPLVVATSGPVASSTTDLDRFLGMPVFSADGALAGLIGRVDGASRIVSVGLAFAAPATPPAAPTPIFGLTLAQSDPGGEAPHVVVRAVASDGVAARAGVHEGDVILLLDGAAATTLEAITPRLQRRDPLVLRVRRGRRVVTLRLVPAEVPQP